MTCWSMCPSRVKQQSGDCREITGPSSGVKPHQKHLLFKKANKNAEPGTGQPALYRWKKTWQVEGSEATMNVWPFPDKRYLPSFLPLSALCLIATTWLSIYQTPAKIYSFFFPYRHHHLVLIVFQTSSLCPVSMSFPASAYQWRWVWEQRQRSSGTISGSSRPNAQGCCGWSGIRGQEETWANQHAERGRQRGTIWTQAARHVPIRM